MAEGFEVHHCDRNYTNNDPENLVLIEGVDHHKLHGKTLSRPTHRRYFDRFLGQLAYYGRMQTKGSWAYIAHKLDVRNVAYIEQVARQFAVENSLLWPLPCVKQRWKVHKRPVYRGY